MNALLAALKRPGERVRAAKVLLAYGYGRPTQHMELAGKLTWEQIIAESLVLLPP